MSIFYGVDPGIRGAIVGIDENSICVYQILLEDIYIKGFGIYDIRHLPSLNEGDYVGIEVPHAVFSKTSKTIARQYSLIGILQAHFWSQSAFYSQVTETQWKKEVLGPIPKGMGKKASIDFCLANIKEIDLTPGRKRAQHDGLADAACIAWRELRRRF